MLRYSLTNILGKKEVCFRSPKMYQHFSTAMQNSKLFPGTILQTPLGRGKFVFGNRKCTNTLLHNNAKFKNIAGDNTPDLWFFGEESLFPFFDNVLIIEN